MSDSGGTLPPPDTTPPPGADDSTSKPWWQRWYTIVGAIVVVLLVIAGIAGGGEDDDEASGSETTTAAPETPVETDPSSETTEAPATTEAPTTTAAPTTTESTTTTTTEPPLTPFPPVVFTGTGQQVITIDDASPARTEPGVVELTHDGGSNFQVAILDENGERLDGLVNDIGGYAGRRPWALRDGDNPKFIEINADGNWSITVFDLIDEENQRIVDYAPGASYTGLGDDVFLLLGSSGPVIMDFFCSDCDSNIQVAGYSDRRDGLINEIGEGGEFNASVVLQTGTRIIEVETNDRDIPGNWVASFQ